MKNRYSWNFLVPEFSILEYSVWKFSVLGFYFPENSGIRTGLQNANTSRSRVPNSNYGTLRIHSL